MKVATWNVGEDVRKENGELDIQSYEYIVKTINDFKIDVICLQEAIIKSNCLPNIANYINENTELKYSVEFELSDSHVNIGSTIGIVICSKHKIDDYEFFKLDNPGLIYSANENKTYYSRDKGFIIAMINNFNIISGHCLPFYVFKKSELDYLDIFYKLDDKLIDIYQNNNKMIVCGDMNYDDVEKYFPKYFDKALDYINEITRKDKRLDHMIVTKEIKVNFVNVIETYSDHKLCLIDIDS